MLKLPIFALCILPVMLAPAAAVSAQTTPSSFSTTNCHLTFDIPPNLFRCQTPPDFSGPDHGVTIYLAKPTGYDSRADQHLWRVGKLGFPNVSVYCEYNVAEMVDRHGDSRPPATNAELKAMECTKRTGTLPRGVVLFNKPAAGCLQRAGHYMTLQAMSLYSQPPGGDADVIITLSTDKHRFQHDFPLFQRITSSIRVCTDRWHHDPHQPRCPEMVRW